MLGQRTLEVVRQVEQLPASVIRQLAMSGLRDDLVVVRAVENADLTSARRDGVKAPEVVVAALEVGRLLERCHPAGLRVHGSEHVPNDRVLAAGIHRLQHHQQRLLLLGIERVLKLGDPLHIAPQRLGCRGFRVPAVVGGIVIGDAEVVGNAKLLDRLHRRAPARLVRRRFRIIMTL
jgi:hypothetical protein